MKLFSVVIPCYNYGRYLSRAIDSVLDQSIDDWELAVVDDGSTDDTPAVLDRYAGRLTAIRTPNRGAPAARNRGIEATSGKYVVLLDADDRLLPDALQHFQGQLERSGDVDLLCGGYVSVSAEGRRRVRPAPQLCGDSAIDFKRCLTGDVHITNGAVAVRREVFDRWQYDETLKVCDDIVFYARMIALASYATVDHSIVETFTHHGRLRDDYAAVVASSEQMAAALFDPATLPPHLLGLRHTFVSRQMLTVFRAHYRAGNYRAANACFWRAVRARPASLLRWSALRKFARSLPAALVTSRVAQG